MDDKNCRGLGTSWHDVLLHCIKAHSKPVLILYERQALMILFIIFRLESEDQKNTATRMHFTNDFLSEETFLELRAKARQIDNDIKKLNETQNQSLLDPEIQEQMRLFELMENQEKLNGQNPAGTADVIGLPSSRGNAVSPGRTSHDATSMAVRKSYLLSARYKEGHQASHSTPNQYKSQ